MKIKKSNLKNIIREEIYRSCMENLIKEFIFEGQFDYKKFVKDPRRLSMLKKWDEITGAYPFSDKQKDKHMKDTSISPSTYYFQTGRPEEQLEFLQTEFKFGHNPDNLMYMEDYADAYLKDKDKFFRKLKTVMNDLDKWAEKNDPKKKPRVVPFIQGFVEKMREYLQSSRRGARA